METILYAMAGNGIEVSEEMPAESQEPIDQEKAPVTKEGEAFGIRQIFGIVGAAILFVGVFAPVVSLPLVGDLNYFQNGEGDGVIILVLAVISLAAALAKKDIVIFFTSLGCLLVLTFTFANFRIRLTQVLDNTNQTDAFSGLTTLMLQSIQLQWGWALLVVGACLTLAPIFIKCKPKDSAVGPFFKVGVGWRRSAGVVSGLCAVAVLVTLVIPTSVAPTTSPAVGTPQETNVGWVLDTSVSPIDDSTIYFLSSEAEEPVDAGFMQTTPVLAIRHKEGSLDVFVSFDSFLGSDEIAVTWRFGELPAKQQVWSLSTDRRSVFWPFDRRAFVRKMLEHDRLVIRLTPFGKSPSDRNIRSQGAL